MAVPCCRWMSVVVFVWLYVSPIVVAKHLLPIDKSDNSLALSDGSESLQQSIDDQDSLWELPIFGPTCESTTPVCGEGGIRFESSCHAIVAGVRILDSGVCLKAVEVVEAKADRSCQIKCFRADPVCGDDGVTYWCGATEAKCAGVEVAHTGFCYLKSDGNGEKGSRAAQSLFLLHLLWLGVAGVMVVAGIM